MNLPIHTALQILVDISTDELQSKRQNKFQLIIKILSFVLLSADVRAKRNTEYRPIANARTLAASIEYHQMISLRKFTIQDYDKLISWIDSAEMLMQFAGPELTFPLTHGQLETSLLDKNRFSFCVIFEHCHIGHAEIYLTEKSAFLARIIIGDNELRGKGIGQEIVNKLLNYAFNTLNQKRIELNVFDWNLNAIKCYQKAGFETNPNKKPTRNINGKNWTAVNMWIDQKK